MIRKSSIILLLMLNGCFGSTILSLGPIPLKTGDIVTKPITKHVIKEEKEKLDNTLKK